MLFSLLFLLQRGNLLVGKLNNMLPVSIAIVSTNVDKRLQITFSSAAVNDLDQESSYWPN